MTLEEHVDDIRNNLKKGLYPNEAAVSQSIVLRLLAALNWLSFNPEVIIPEYSVGGRRVDLALCHPPLKPQVFIEVKQVGNIEGAESQLFEYAFHQGVLIAILTDGQKWRFFYPSGQGDYRERRVHEFDLVENRNEEIAYRLNRYLSYKAVQTGEAIRAVREDYEKLVQQRQVAARLPEAWSKLVEEADEFLLHAVAEKTHKLCGHRPTDEQVLDFLKRLVERKTDPPIPPKPNDDKEKQSRRERPQRGRLVVTMPNGEKIHHPFSSTTFVVVIEKLGVERVRGLNKKCKIPLISTDKHPRYPQIQLGQYYIVTDSRTETKKRLLEEIAAELGESLTVSC